MGPFKWTPSVFIREGFGKTNASAQMLFTSGQLKWTGIITVEEKRRKKNCKTKFENREFFVLSLRWEADGKEGEWNLTADCISRGGECDSVLYLQCRKVETMGHKTFLSWIWLVTLSQCKQILYVDTHTHTHFHKEQHLGKLPVCLGLY